MKRHEKSGHQEKIDQFCDAKSLSDIARLLNFKPKDLSYILYTLDGGRENQYTTFTIPKRSGGERVISAPKSGLKEVQRRLNELLQIIYWERPSVHSFIKKRSIITNAIKHRHKRYIFNVDLKDFFPSINFGRVRGLFIAGPYNIDPKAATVIAQIACHANQLPQGSPSSPIISNMICSMMDKQLQEIAKREHCIYTRYVDDITFSTNLEDFPKTIGCLASDSVHVGDELKKNVESNGFQINEKKTNLQTPDMRQEVTGLIVNKFVNVRRKLVRQVRAMLHAWEKFGLSAAESEHHTKYLSLQEGANGPEYRNVVRGKIEFIRMVRSNNKHGNNQGKQKDDYVAQKLLTKLFECLLREGGKPIIRTEGHTDWMHISAAWEKLKTRKKYEGIDLDFLSVKEYKCYGNQVLLKFCKNAQRLRPFTKKVICVFDSDDKTVNKEHGKAPFRNWGNNVYSFLLPPVSDFIGKEVSIEMFHYKTTLKIKDDKFRRLFLSDEFDDDGKHKKLKNTTYGYDPIQKKRIPNWKEHLKGPTKIFDKGVFKKKGKKTYSLALSKGHFARCIYKKANGFDRVNFDKFGIIFDKILEILKA